MNPVHNHSMLKICWIIFVLHLVKNESWFLSSLKCVWRNASDVEKESFGLDSNQQKLSSVHIFLHSFTFRIDEMNDEFRHKQTTRENKWHRGRHRGEKKTNVKNGKIGSTVAIASKWDLHKSYTVFFSLVIFMTVTVGIHTVVCIQWHSTLFAPMHWYANKNQIFNIVQNVYSRLEMRRECARASANGWTTPRMIFCWMNRVAFYNQRSDCIHLSCNGNSSASPKYSHNNSNEVLKFGASRVQRSVAKRRIRSKRKKYAHTQKRIRTL